MPTTTANLGLTLPTPNVDTGWGNTLNTDFTIIDNIFSTSGTGVSLNIGSGKTLQVAGTLLLGSGDGTANPNAANVKAPAATGTNIAGVDLTIKASNGTGTGGSGDIFFQTAPSGSSGSTANTLRTVLSIKKGGKVGILTATPADDLQIDNQENPAANTMFRVTNLTASGQFGVESDGSVRVYNKGSFPVKLGTADTERFRIGPNGEFGVGGASYGTTGQILKSNGAGSPPVWADASAASIKGWVWVETLTPSAAASVVTSSLSTYTAIRVTFTNLKTAVGSQCLKVSARNAGGATIADTSYVGILQKFRQPSSPIIPGYDTTESIAGGTGILTAPALPTATDIGLSGTLIVTNGNVNQYTAFESSLTFGADGAGVTSAAVRMQTSNMMLASTDIVDKLVFTTRNASGSSTSTITASSIVIEGLKI